MKCKVCGKRMVLRPEDRYEVREQKALMTALSEVPKVYEAFDCKNCGCQIIVNIRLTKIHGGEGEA